MFNAEISEIVNKLSKNKKSVNLAIAQYSHEIDELKKGFESTDYRTLKNIQAERLSLDLPYSWEEIHEEAEAIRLKIRDRENKIETLMTLTEEVPAEGTESNSADA